MRISMILILMFGFTACEQEGVTNASKVGAPTRGGGESEGVDGGIGDVLPSIITTDVQPATVTSDVQPAIAISDVQPATMDVQPVNSLPDSGTVKVAKTNPCVYDQQEVCQKSNCTSEQQHGVDFAGCFVVVKPAGNSEYHVVTCGWEPTINSCFQTIWCEESYPSVGLNDAGKMQPVIIGTGSMATPTGTIAHSSVHLIPKSSVCNGGKATFAPGTLKVWGKDISGSTIANDPDYGFVCVPNTQTIILNC